jgi:NAD(P)-dependent dehydrogenase (short-subunit alcohol dehydrogenase family)
LPLLGLDKTLIGKSSKIINISSVAGKRGLPFLGPYAASKHAMEGWSESLRRELMPFGIDVIVIGPGTIKTPIWDKAEAQGMDEFQHTPYKDSLQKFGDFAIAAGNTGLDVSVIGDLMVRILESKKPKTRYAVLPKPFINKFLPAILPTRVLDRLIAKKFGLWVK